jgi:hypothetical protein
MHEPMSIYRNDYVQAFPLRLPNGNTLNNEVILR